MIIKLLSFESYKESIMLKMLMKPSPAPILLCDILLNLNSSDKLLWSLAIIFQSGTGNKTLDRQLLN